MTSKKIILCLHGWRTNQHVMRLQCTDVLEHAGDAFIIQYLDAPNQAKGPAYEAVELAFSSCKEKGDGWKEWYDYNAPDKATNSAATYVGLETSIEYVESEVQRIQPYALCGFSQGGTIAAIVAKRLQDQGETYCEKLLMFCAVPPNDFYNTFPWDKPIEIPSLHCIGERDPMKQRSHQFAEQSFDSSTQEICVHSGNHKPPSIFEKRDASNVFDVVKNFLAR